MARFYDARGNIYAVTTPQMLREQGIAVPANASEAAACREDWANAAVQAICAWPDDAVPDGAKAHRSDGLLLGPFQDRAPFDLLIINTDGTLAERSGNGLTIFAQCLTDNGLVNSDEAFALRVHHDKSDSATPLHTCVEPAQVSGGSGFWLDLGTPAFGPAAVSAQPNSLMPLLLNERPVSQVNVLAQIEPSWGHSVFVRVGNPHCVTLVPSEANLPAFAALHDHPLNSALTRIAFAAGEWGAGEPCPAGVNLQWAWAVSATQVMARVFERGEGPTASSGTSASAVACAAWQVGWVQAGLVEISMPGGTAPVRLAERDGELVGVALFGVASRIERPKGSAI